MNSMTEEVPGILSRSENIAAHNSASTDIGFSDKYTGRDAGSRKK